MKGENACVFCAYEDCVTCTKTGIRIDGKRAESQDYCRHFVLLASMQARWESKFGKKFRGEVSQVEIR